MGLLEIVLIGIGLSMDAAAVSVSNGLAYPKMEREFKWAMPIAFGVFQGLMPVLGYFAGGVFADFISRYAGIVTLVILGVIGAKMIADTFNEGEENTQCAFTYRLLYTQAIATSIDAFAVGVSFCAEGADIFAAAPIIAVTTFICSLFAMALGKKIGHKLGKNAQIFGGAVLVLLGIKAIF